MIIAENKKALFNYQIQEKFSAGLKLSGPEVKSAKSGKIDLSGSYVIINFNPLSQTNEIWLENLKISKYSKSGYSQKGYDPSRKRKLLLNRKEINYLTGKIKQKGLTIVPILVYTSQRLIKVEIAIVQGKKKFDKREQIKKREFDRNKQRMMSAKGGSA
jgi:SsrA-binding protein